MKLKQEMNLKDASQWILVQLQSLTSLQVTFQKKMNLSMVSKMMSSSNWTSCLKVVSVWRKLLWKNTVMNQTQLYTKFSQNTWLQLTMVSSVLTLQTSVVHVTLTQLLVFQMLTHVDVSSGFTLVLPSTVLTTWCKKKLTTGMLSKKSTKKLSVFVKKLTFNTKHFKTLFALVTFMV